MSSDRRKRMPRYSVIVRPEVSSTSAQLRSNRRRPHMLRFIAFVATIVAFALAADGARAKDLTKNQVATVCGQDVNYCEKKCGLNGEYTWGFGCGSKGCSGQCLTCPSRISTGAINAIVTGTMSNAPTSGGPAGVSGRPYQVTPTTQGDTGLLRQGV